MNKIVLIFGLFFSSCFSDKFQKYYCSYFKEHRNDYNLLSEFLNRHEREVIDAKCDSLESIQTQNLEDCFPSIKDSLSFFINKQLFKSFDYHPDKSIAFLLKAERSSTKDLELYCYYIYAYDGELPRIYSYYAVIEKLSSNWWYVEHRNASF
jgi:hypothetical protein